MEEHQILAGFLHQHLKVGHVVAFSGQIVELVVVGGKHRAAAQIAGQVFAHGPGDGEAVERCRASANFIEQHEGAITGVVKDVGGFRHLHHEGGLTGRQIIHSTHAGEDSIGNANGGGAGGHPTADLRHQLDEADLAQVAALATGVGAGEHHQVGAITELHIIGDEGGLHQPLLHHGVTAGLQLQDAAVGDGGSAVAPCGSDIGQARERIQRSDGASCLTDRSGHGADLLTQLAKQLIFPLAGACPQLEDAAFPLFEIRGDEPFLIGQGLAADPVVRHRRGLGFAHRQEIAEGAVVLQLQGGDTAALALLLLLIGKPGVLIIQLVAQPIKERVNPVVDQSAFTEAQRWGLQQLVADNGRQFRQGRLRLGEWLQPVGFLCDLTVQLGCQLWQPFESIRNGDDIAGPGMASSGTTGQPLEITHRPQQLPDRQPQAALFHQP